MTIKYLTTATACILMSVPIAAWSQQCTNVRFSDVGWADITATTALASEVLSSIGYNPSDSLLSVPVTYRSLANNDLDVFLGNWMPTMAADIAPYHANGSVETLRANLEGAKYTLAVNQAAYDGGLRSFSDIARFSRELNGRIYGIEPGNDGNRLIQDMINDNAFGLGDFSLMESSEAGMISQVQRSLRRNEWIVFLGWEPHPMNANFDLVYLTDGDDWFGPDFGAATVYTNVRAGFTEDCPNLGTFFNNLEFTLTMENEVMSAMLDDGQEPAVAARTWLTNNPEVLTTWLQGVTTLTGEPALPVAQASFR